MPKDYKPPRDAADTFARYKTAYEDERAIKPDMLEFADRELKAGATVGQLAKLTGLTPEVFRRRARALGVEHKRAPTVGKLSAAPAEAVAATPPEQPQPPEPTAAPRRRKKPEPREGRPLTDEEAKTLAATAFEQASEMQKLKLQQLTANTTPGYEDFAVVSTALDLGLLTHDEVYAEPSERPVSGEETSG
ncbi:hypothetical protein ACFZC6_01875 [Streptomyces ossamyceticus]|uniref:hypothetical protein n=1 Tax=Streptomyces ossamyceticus TaxID=249581 RepID=UPI0036F18AF2